MDSIHVHRYNSERNIFVVFNPNAMSPIFSTDAIIYLREVISDLRVFNNCDDCIDFITDLSEQRANVVISNNIDEFFVNLLYSLPQIALIYVWNSNQTNEMPIGYNNQNGKVKGPYETLKALRSELFRQGRNEQLSFNIASSNSANSSYNAHQSVGYIYGRLFLNILVCMDDWSDARQDLVAFFRQENEANNIPSQWIDEFEQSFMPTNAIKWYTRSSFIFGLLNRTLHNQIFQDLYKLRYFIIHLHNELMNLHRKQEEVRTEQLVLYRGSKISFNLLSELMEPDMTHIVSFNSFLSTSKSDIIALCFADSCHEDKDLCTALIQININVNQDSKFDSCIFADINLQSSYDSEEEVLFSCGSTFRIDKSVPPKNDPHDPKTRFWTISMAPISNGGSELQKFVDYERKKLGRMPPLLAFSQLMLDMEQFDDVQVFVQLSLNKLTSEHRAQAYNILAQCYLKRGDYIQAKLNLDHALKLSQSNNHPARSEVLSTHLHYLLAQNHENAHMLEIAKEAFCCAIDIEQKGQRLIDLGRIYTRSGQVEIARLCYLAARLVLLANLPDIHPTITSLQMCESELELQQNNALISLVHQLGAINRFQTMPPNHSDFARFCHQNALIYEQNGKYEEAYNFALLASGAATDNDNLPEQHPFRIECKEHLKKLTLHFNGNPPDSRRLAEMWLRFQK